VEFGPKQVEPLSQERNYNPDSREFVSLITIDSFAYDKIDLMKIDAEGMEIQVLDGAADLIKRSRPIMYIEYLKADQVALLQRVINYDYSVYLNNINFLCIPSELNGSMLAKIPEILKNHGDTLFNNGQLVNAECAYREAIALKPESAEVHNNLGCVLHRTKRFDEAERAYSKTIDLLPDSAIAYINLGLAFVASGKFVEAEQVFRRAAVLNPDYTEGYNTHWATLL
jgi:tetratricopeptide (TPR) repeat protein